MAASVITTRHDKLRKRWQIEGGLPPVPGSVIDPSAITFSGRNVGSSFTPSDVDLIWKKTDFTLRGRYDLACNFDEKPIHRGTFIIIDCTSGEIVWREAWGSSIVTPTGFVFDRDKLYVADSESASIFVADLTRLGWPLTERITNPAFNDIHSIQRTSRGLLVACSGSDAIIEVDLNGDSLWEWWAAEQGFDISPSGHKRASGRLREHRDTHYHTRFQATHVNCARFADAQERFIIATLFHQGHLIKIDRELPERSTEILMHGLSRPHSIRKTSSGWTLANSWAKEYIELDNSFAITSRRTVEDGGWLQDCLLLSNQLFAINDVDQHKIKFLSRSNGSLQMWIDYDPMWRIYELYELVGRDLGLPHGASALPFSAKLFN